jgi:hypothetical protein
MKKLVTRSLSLALAALALITMFGTTNAAMVVHATLTEMLPTKEQVRDGVFPQNSVISFGTMQLYASFSVYDNNETPVAFVVNTGSFTITRSGAAPLGPISFGGGLYPGTSPVYTAWDENDLEIDLTNQPVGGNGVPIYKFTFTSAVLPIPTVDQPGEMATFTPLIGFDPVGAPPPSSVGATATATVVPEPSALMLSLLGCVTGGAFLRRRK